MTQDTQRPATCQAWCGGTWAPLHGTAFASSSRMYCSEACRAAGRALNKQSQHPQQGTPGDVGVRPTAKQVAEEWLGAQFFTNTNGTISQRDSLMAHFANYGRAVLLEAARLAEVYPTGHKRCFCVECDVAGQLRKRADELGRGE